MSYPSSEEDEAGVGERSFHAVLMRAYRCFNADLMPINAVSTLFLC